MHDCHSITAWCVFVMLSFYDTCSGSTCYWSTSYAAMRYCIVWGPSWGPSIWGPSVSDSINTLWQPERLTWSVYRITCFFWHDIIHVTMYFLMSYDVIYLWFMLSMLSIYAHRYDAILYCMGTIWESSIWGPTYGDHWYGDHRYTSISI